MPSNKRHKICEGTHTGARQPTLAPTPIHAHADEMPAVSAGNILCTLCGQDAAGCWGSLIRQYALDCVIIIKTGNAWPTHITQTSANSQPHAHANAHRCTKAVRLLHTFWLVQKCFTELVAILKY